MEKQTDTTEYEAPRIEDHGDLTELTAAVGTKGTFDQSFTAGYVDPDELRHHTRRPQPGRIRKPSYAGLLCETGI